MNMNRNYLNRQMTRLGLLVLITIIVCTVAGIRAQPVQAGLLLRKTPTPTRTRIPTRTPTPIKTPTATLPPPVSPTSGPTTTVNGTWKIVSSPNVGTGTYGNKLNSVAVVSTNDIWAVGFSPAPSGTPLYIRQSLIQHWDGGSWSVAASPNPAGKPDVELNGVDAISTNDIWAVGHSGDPSYIPYQTLTEHWNGSNWSIVSSPSPGTYNGNDLYGVAAISANDVWAVGWYQSGPTGQEGGALTMHWDGANWTVVPNPSKATFNAVTAFASNDVWAAGQQAILHWNGSVWTSVPFPLPPTQNSFVVLRGLSGNAPNDLWAVGYNQFPYFSGYRYVPVAYHWNGSVWSLVPNAGATDEFLNAVVALASNDVWGAGDNGQFQHWNGAAWSRVSSPYPGLGGSLRGLAAASAGDIWAVGWYSDSTSYQIRTWIDRYTAP